MSRTTAPRVRSDDELWIIATAALLPDEEWLDEEAERRWRDDSDEAAAEMRAQRQDEQESVR